MVDDPVYITFQEPITSIIIRRKYPTLNWYHAGNTTASGFFGTWEYDKSEIFLWDEDGLWRKIL
jgi:hypothetical protein